MDGSIEVGSLNLEDVANENERLQSTGQSNFIDNFVPMPENEGYTTIRLLPPRKGAKLYQGTRLHYINGRKVHCRRELVNGKWKGECPICDYYNSLWRKVDKLEQAGNTDEADSVKEEARSIKPIERYYYNAIVRKLATGDGDVENNVGPRILSVGKKLHQKVITAIVGNESEGEDPKGDVTDFKSGYDFKIVKKITGSGRETYPNYDNSKFLDKSSPAGEMEELKEWVGSLHDLTTLRTVKDVDFLKKELAVHRKLIPDDTTGFDIDEFDAAYGGNGQAQAQAQAPQQTVEDVVGNTSVVEEPVTAEAPTPEDVPIEDKAFMKSLREMTSED